jgi:hypothetical protein
MLRLGILARTSSRRCLATSATSTLFTEEHDMLRATARKIIDHEINPHVGTMMQTTYTAVTQ